MVMDLMLDGLEGGLVPALVMLLKLAPAASCGVYAGGAMVGVGS